MNIQWIRMKGVVRELHGIRTQLERIADCMEMELAQNGVNMRPPKADTSGEAPTITYVDEEMEAVREMVDRYKREDAIKAEEEA
jgi:hypothetical protein